MPLTYSQTGMRGKTLRIKFNRDEDVTIGDVSVETMGGFKLKWIYSDCVRDIDT